MFFCLLSFLWTEPAQSTENQYYEVFFPPKARCLPRIIKLIDTAKKSVYLQCYSFTSKPIAIALLKAKRRGVDVQIVTDKSQIKANGSLVVRLHAKKIPVFVDHRVAIAHNKTMIIDGRIVLTGSYNWTNAAEKRNAENLVIFYNHAGLAKDYMQNWTERKDSSIAFC
jgi:phosphatidylserine/phosphatidylglycerophosphate/cardiolipin synthase-like enzyme